MGMGESIADAGRPRLTHNLSAPASAPCSMFYRNWSGLYQMGSSRLVLNNGLGNWFPLRINTPAEVIELTRHRK